ncbi:MAG: hypothetical protein CM1200mP12_16170 [Gammaproteobacteria bacterium]|nr:MAG: hypothetical protein CM1200mP12_16170 [Gammaproteobacteria bacterium]
MITVTIPRDQEYDSNSKRIFPESEITLVFQPHRFTRTKDPYKEFVEVLKSVERLILLEIYSAGEEAIDGISSTTFLESIKNTGFEDFFLAQSNAQA